MIFQLSERERFSFRPRATLRFSVQRVVKPAPRTAPEPNQESKPSASRFATTLDANGGVPFRQLETGSTEPEATRPFEDCEKYEAQGGCQTVLHQRYEGNRGDIMRCNTCGRTFSARRGGINFRSRLSPEMLRQLIDCHGRGDSIRKTSKELDLNRGTVRRYYRLLEEGASIDQVDL